MSVLIQLVLLGQSGAGKSSLGNVIIGKKDLAHEHFFEKKEKEEEESKGKEENTDEIASKKEKKEDVLKEKEETKDEIAPKKEKDYVFGGKEENTKQIAPHFFEKKERKEDVEKEEKTGDTVPENPERVTQVKAKETTEQISEGQKENKEKGLAFGCQCLPASISCDSKQYSLRIVDTPGIFQEGVTSAEKSWKDMVQSFYMSMMKVDLFVIVLKASDPKTGEEVIKSFVDFFGHEAPLHSVVVFTHIEKHYTERKLLFQHYEYLLKYMKFGFPYIQWTHPNDEWKLPEFVQIIEETTVLQPYNNDEFSEAQFEFSKKWITQYKAKLKKKRLPFVKSDRELTAIGVPDLLIDKILSDNQKKRLIKFANSSV